MSPYALLAFFYSTSLTAAPSCKSAVGQRAPVKHTQFGQLDGMKNAGKRIVKFTMGTFNISGSQNVDLKDSTWSMAFVNSIYIRLYFLRTFIIIPFYRIQFFEFFFTIHF